MILEDDLGRQPLSQPWKTTLEDKLRRWPWKKTSKTTLEDILRWPGRLQKMTSEDYLEDPLFNSVTGVPLILVLAAVTVLRLLVFPCFCEDAITFVSTQKNGNKSNFCLYFMICTKKNKTNKTRNLQRFVPLGSIHWRRKEWNVQGKS